MQYRVTVHFDPDENFYSESWLFTGLALLAEQREIDLNFRPRTQRHRDPAELLVPRLEIHHLQSATTKFAAFDLYDRSDIFCAQALESCDLYFKRCFYRPHMTQHCGNLPHKVHPLGFVFACQSDTSISRVLRAVRKSYFARLLAHPTRIRRLRGDSVLLRAFTTSPHIQLFQQPPDAPVETKVFYQTRVWEPDDTTDNADEVNQERVETVRVLQQAFGDRFCGGLVPTPYALKHFPQDITPNDSHRHQYVTLAKSFLVGVYTRGLHHSLAFKFPEYLAASQCIVSPNLRNELPVPLDAGSNYLPFSTPDECVEQCARLLDDPDRAAQMRRANYHYFRQNVHPAARLRTCLDETFRSPIPSAEQLVSAES
jgi:hypothetical protein